MKKQTIAAALAAALVGSAFLGTGMQTEAAQWMQDGTGWWDQEDNGSYPAGTVSGSGMDAAGGIAMRTAAIQRTAGK